MLICVLLRKIKLQLISNGIDKIDVGSDALDYHISRDETRPIIQRSRDFCYAQFRMERMVRPRNSVP